MTTLIITLFHFLFTFIIYTGGLYVTDHRPIAYLVAALYFMFGPIVQQVTSLLARIEITYRTKDENNE